LFVFKISIFRVTERGGSGARVVRGISYELGEAEISAAQSRRNVAFWFKGLDRHRADLGLVLVPGAMSLFSRRILLALALPRRVP